MKAFREAIESGDHEASFATLAEDVSFRSPAVFSPYEGKAAASVILFAVNSVFEDFRYTRVVEVENYSVLVFETHIGEIHIEGADYLTHQDGKITDFRVMIRPLKGLQAVVESMGKAIPGAMAQLGVSADQMKPQRS